MFDQTFPHKNIWLGTASAIFAMIFKLPLLSSEWWCSIFNSRIFFNLAMELSILSKASCLRNIYQLQNSIWRIFRSEKFFFSNKKSSAINRNVCIQLFYNDNDNTWWRSPRQTSCPWYIRLHILSLQSNMLHLIEKFIFSHKAPVYFQSWIWRLEKRGDASVLYLCL